MNTENIEDKIISYFENELSETEIKEIDHLRSNNPEINMLFIQYNKMYSDLENIPKHVPSDKMRVRFNQFLNEEIKQKKRGRIKSLYVSISAIAAIFIGGIFIANYLSEDSNVKTEQSPKLASIDLISNHKPTNRIKAIRVNYKEQNGVDDKMVKTLVEVLENDESSNVRLVAVQTLGDFIDRSEVRESLIRHLSYEDDGIVKLEIINVLARIKDQKSKTTLENIAKDESQQKFVKDEAYMQLIRFEPENM